MLTFVFSFDLIYSKSFKSILNAFWLFVNVASIAFIISRKLLISFWNLFVCLIFWNLFNKIVFLYIYIVFKIISIYYLLVYILKARLQVFALVIFLRTS